MEEMAFDVFTAHKEELLSLRERVKGSRCSWVTHPLAMLRLSQLSTVVKFHELRLHFIAVNDLEEDFAFAYA